MRPTIRRCTFFPCLLAMTSAVLLGGCAQSPRLDREFGDSVRLVKAQQTLNPDAARQRAPVMGLDGPAARSAYDNYQRSFAAPESQANGFTISSGGVTSR